MDARTRELGNFVPRTRRRMVGPTIPSYDRRHAQSQYGRVTYRVFRRVHFRRSIYIFFFFDISLINYFSISHM